MIIRLRIRNGRQLHQLATFTHRGPRTRHLHVASCHARLSGHLHIASTYTLLPTAMEGLSRETVQRKPNFCAKLKDIFKAISIFKWGASRAPSQPSRTATPVLSAQRDSSKMGRNAGVGKRLHLHCWQGLLSKNQYPAGSTTTTPIDNRGDTSKGSGVAAASECFHPKSFQ